MKLKPIPSESYARDVLPQTAGLWAGHRDFDTYVAQTGQIADSRYGKKFYQTFGLFDGTEIVASCKRYERVLHLGEQQLGAIGFGAVFTPATHRGRGYASAMLAMMLDDARSHGLHLGYLFSDIHPAFYKQLGFIEFPSRAISLRADSLAHSRIAVSNVETADWPGIRKCFDLCEGERVWGFTRSPLVWHWIRLRFRQSAQIQNAEAVNLVIRKGKRVVAYVIGQRDVAHDVFVVDEYGFADLEGRSKIPALLRSAAGDLRRLAGWLPPQGARELLPRGSVRKRKVAILMMAPLTPLGTKLVEKATITSAPDGAWSIDHI